MKYKKAIISAVAVIVIGAAAIGLAVAKKNAAVPPSENPPIEMPSGEAVTAEEQAEVTTIDFSEAEEFIVGLSDTDVTDELKEKLSAINVALENYLASRSREKCLITEYGFLYDDKAGNNITVKDLAASGDIQADEDILNYTDILYIRASDLAKYADNIDDADTKLQLFTAYNSSEGYFVSNDFYSEGAMLSQKDYESLVMSYKFTNGEVRNPKSGDVDYDGIIAATGISGLFDVKHIACDNKYGVAVIGSLEDTTDIKEYVCVLDNGKWTLGMEGLETSETPRYDVNMKYPNMELGLLPKYTIANYGNIQNGFSKYYDALVQLKLVKESDLPATYDCGASKFCYMEFGDTHLLGCVNLENKLEFYPVSSVEEAIAYMLKYDDDPPVFIINFHN